MDVATKHKKYTNANIGKFWGWGGRSLIWLYLLILTWHYIKSPHFSMYRWFFHWNLHVVNFPGSDSFDQTRFEQAAGIQLAAGNWVSRKMAYPMDPNGARNSNGSMDYKSSISFNFATYLSRFIDDLKWWFPSMGVPLNHPFSEKNPVTNPPFWVTPWVWKQPYMDPFGATFSDHHEYRWHTVPFASVAPGRSEDCWEWHCWWKQQLHRRGQELKPLFLKDLDCQGILLPIGSMYAICGNIYHEYTPVMLASIYHTTGSVNPSWAIDWINFINSTELHQQNYIYSISISSVNPSLGYRFDQLDFGLSPEVDHPHPHPSSPEEQLQLLWSLWQAPLGDG